MPQPIIDAVAVSSTNMERTIAFYTLFGFDFEGEGAFISDEHVEPVRRAGEPRLMIDTAQMMENLMGEAPRAPNHSIFGFLCESPAEVDRIAEQAKAAGHAFKVEPWDAFWGQRYATLIDPDGYMVDIFAELPAPV